MKKVFVGKVVFMILVYVFSFIGGPKNYLDLSFFIGTLIAGTVIRLIYSSTVKNKQLQKHASISYIVVGFIWTIVLGVVQMGGTDMSEVIIWLPIFFGLLISAFDDLIFWRNNNENEKASRKKYMVTLFVVGILVILLVSTGIHSIIQFFNGPYLLYVLIIVLPMLIITDTFSDVINGIRFSINKKYELTTKELKAAKVGFKLVIYGVIIGCLISIFNIMPYFVSNSNNAGLSEAYVDIMMITPLYGVIISGFIAIVNAIIEKEIVYRES